MAYAATVVIPSRWVQPGSYALIDLGRSGVVRASPFRPATPPRVPFGRRVASPIPAPERGVGGRILPIIGGLIILGEAIDRFVVPRRPWQLQLFGPWYIARDCGIEPDCYLTAGAQTDPGDPFGGCYLGQYSWDYDGTDVDWGLQVTNDQKTIIFGRKVDEAFPYRYDTALKVSRAPGDWGCTWGDWYDPDCTPIVTQPRPAVQLVPPPVGTTGLPGVHSEQDPNVERAYRRGVGTPIPGYSHPEPVPEEIPNFRIEIQPTPGPGLGTIAGANAPSRQAEPATSVSLVPGNPYPTPAPPRPYEKEKKVVTKGKQAILAAWRILDFVSEVGDMVEALYAALPAKVRRAFEAEERRRRGLPRNASLERPGDQMGQYGLNGADWRLRALWRYWDQLDAPQAVHNLIANEVEDRAYGRAYAARDRLQLRGQYRPRPL